MQDSFLQAHNIARSLQRIKTQNSWITAGIIISCRKKRVLYAEVKKARILKFGNIIRNTVKY
jgi:nitrogenase subunit NifH